MECLSYTLLALAVGRLPWESRTQRRLSSRRLFDLKKQWSGARLTGEASLLGEFIDYARSLSYTEKPDYVRWRDRFRTLVRDLPDDPLYEHADSAGPPAKSLAVNVDLPEEAFRFEFEDNPEGENLPRGPGDPPMSGSWPDPSGSAGIWIPTSTWDPAVPLEEDELLGDESRIVMEVLDVIDEVPEAQKRYLMRISDPEVMRTSNIVSTFQRSRRPDSLLMPV